MHFTSNTALHLASLNSHLSVAEFLIQMGAHVNNLNKEGKFTINNASLHLEIKMGVMEIKND